MWASVPHYVAEPPNPKAALALLTRLEDVLNLPLDPGELHKDAERWVEQVNELVSDDPDISSYITALEERRDEATPPPTGDAIAAEFERYLRRRRPQFRVQLVAEQQGFRRDHDGRERLPPRRRESGRGREATARLAHVVQPERQRPGRTRRHGGPPEGGDDGENEAGNQPALPAVDAEEDRPGAGDPGDELDDEGVGEEQVLHVRPVSQRPE